MAVITISREPYSGGRTLGTKIADDLGYPLFTKKDFTEIFKEYGLISFEDFYESTLTVWERIDELGMEYMNFLVKVTRGIGAMDNAVIVGRGSFAVFPDFRDVINIRLWAPLETRISRCMEKEGVDRDKARKIVERQDKLRLSFITHCYHLHQSDIANAFDMVLNTSKVSDAGVLELVRGTMEQLKSVSGEGALTKNLPYDKVLTDTINKVLSAHAA